MSGIRQFRRRSPQSVFKPSVKKEKDRRSRQERGYDADWEKCAAQYRRQPHVLGRCEECFRRGYLGPADVVDHMVPISEDASRRLDLKNLDCLCHRHHNGWKRRLEEYAKRTNQVSQLPVWVKHPEMRPIQFQIIKFGPMKEIFDAEVGGRQ